MAKILKLKLFWGKKENFAKYNNLTAKTVDKHSTHKHLCDLSTSKPLCLDVSYIKQKDLKRSLKCGSKKIKHCPYSRVERIINKLTTV